MGVGGRVSEREVMINHHVLFDPRCRACQLAHAQDNYAVDLGGGWTVNSYRGSEGFLGWLALTPRQHRVRLCELTRREAASLGSVIQWLDSALSAYWQAAFSDDPLQRVYVAYFSETVDDPNESERWHLHWHVLPRPRSLRWVYEDSDRGVWGIHRAHCDPRFPTRYKLEGRGEERARDSRVQALITFLRARLRARPPAIGSA